MTRNLLWPSCASSLSAADPASPAAACPAPAAALRSPGWCCCGSPSPPGSPEPAPLWASAWTEPRSRTGLWSARTPGPPPRRCHTRPSRWGPPHSSPGPTRSPPWRPFFWPSPLSYYVSSATANFLPPGQFWRVSSTLRIRVYKYLIKALKISIKGRKDLLSITGSRVRALVWFVRDKYRLRPAILRGCGPSLSCL